MESMEKLQAYRNLHAPADTRTQNVMDLAKKLSLNNIYATTVAIAKRADEISQELKHELNTQLIAVSYTEDNPEKEEFRNEEQIELSRPYERLPKPVLLATQEYVMGRLTVKELSEEDVEREQRATSTTGLAETPEAAL